MGPLALPVRRAGARFAAKDSALIYLSPPPRRVTPFYAGELLRVVLLGKRYARHRFDIVAIWLLGAPPTCWRCSS